MDSTILVSVIVVTYNSAATVIETLDSIKNQDYPNIELIIADDCSKDNTVDIVKKWLDENDTHFVRSELITSSVNTGVSGNLNRGLNKAQGKWIKPIAGDDLLMPDCVSENVRCTKTDARVCAVSSRALFFGDPIICKQFEHFGYGLFGLTNREKYLVLLTYNCIISPTDFVSREYYESIGGFNEEIPLIEDWPFWINVFKNNGNVIFLNKETVKYRMGSSLSLGGGGGGKYDESYRIMLDYVYKLQMRENLLYRLYALLLRKQREKKTILGSILIRMNVYHYYYIFLRRKINRASREFDRLKEE